jgi:hypothetical protein
MVGQELSIGKVCVEVSPSCRNIWIIGKLAHHCLVIMLLNFLVRAPASQPLVAKLLSDDWFKGLFSPVSSPGIIWLELRFRTRQCHCKNGLAVCYQPHFDHTFSRFQKTFDALNDSLQRRARGSYSTFTMLEQPGGTQIAPKRLSLLGSTPFYNHMLLPVNFPCLLVTVFGHEQPLAAESCILSAACDWCSTTDYSLSTAYRLLDGAK